MVILAKLSHFCYRALPTSMSLPELDHHQKEKLRRLHPRVESAMVRETVPQSNAWTKLEITLDFLEALEARSSDEFGKIISLEGLENGASSRLTATCEATADPSISPSPCVSPPEGEEMNICGRVSSSSTFTAPPPDSNSVSSSQCFCVRYCSTGSLNSTRRFLFPPSSSSCTTDLEFLPFLSLEYQKLHWKVHKKHCFKPSW